MPDFGASNPLGPGKTVTPGYACYPDLATGLTVTDGASGNAYGTYVQFVASTADAIFITGGAFKWSTGGGSPNYFQIAIGTGGAGSETIVAVKRLSVPPDGTGATFSLPFPIPVAASTRIAVKLATSTDSEDIKLTLEYINQSVVVAM